MSRVAFLKLFLVILMGPLVERIASRFEPRVVDVIVLPTRTTTFYIHNRRE